MSNEYSSGQEISNPLCIVCGEPTSNKETFGRGKVYIDSDCIETKEPEEQDVETREKNVIFTEERESDVEPELQQLIKAVSTCQSCDVDDPREAEDPSQELCPECAADWNWWRENHDTQTLEPEQKEAETSQDTLFNKQEDEVRKA